LSIMIANLKNSGLVATFFCKPFWEKLWRST
jgi:hypothetical protein